MTKVVICVGPGGVGKTTMAAALGVRAAKKGRKTLVLTIDPSRRLAQTLGIGDAVTATRVPGADYAGELWAGVVDHKQTFDEFVRRAAGKSPSAEKLLQNRLYQQLKSTLAGSQDFTALEKLYSSVRDGGYDLVILDTPPAQHAVEFLQAPAKIAVLFNDGIAKWFRNPEGKAGLFQKVLSLGTKQILKVLEGLTGGEFIRELSDFFRQIESWQGKLEERTAAVHRLLTSADTSFCLVSGADRTRLTEASAFVIELRRGGYRLENVLVNRTVPQWWSETQPAVPAALENLYLASRKLVKEQITRVQDFASQLKDGTRVTMLPEWDERIYDLKGLEKVADVLDQELSR